MKKTKIRTFTDLEAWKQSHLLVLAVYKSTNKFPKEEKFSLIDQMRRSALSISSNIAEGFSRQGNKEKLQFYYTAKGSLTELQNQLMVCRDIGYLGKNNFDKISDLTIFVSKLITGLIKSIRNRS
jgi:four helix bundle protein